FRSSIGGHGGKAGMFPGGFDDISKRWGTSSPIIGPWGSETPGQGEKLLSGAPISMAAFGRQLGATAVSWASSSPRPTQLTHYESIKIPRLRSGCNLECVARLRLRPV